MYDVLNLKAERDFLKRFPTIDVSHREMMPLFNIRYKECIVCCCNTEKGMDRTRDPQQGFNFTMVAKQPNL
jgi:hypothetical protein